MVIIHNHMMLGGTIWHDNDMNGLPTFMPCISFFIRKYSCACKISTQPYRHLRVAGFYDMASRMAYITWTDLASEKLCDLSFWRPRYREHRLGCLYRVRFALLESERHRCRVSWEISRVGTSVYQEMPKKCLSATFFKPFGCNIERIFPSMHFFLLQLFRRPHQYAFPRAF